MSSTTHKRSDTVQEPGLVVSLIPLVVLIVLLAGNVYFFKDEGLGGPNQIALLLAASIAIGLSVWLKNSVRTLLDHVYESMRTALPAMIILLLVGALAGTWMASGIVPAMIYYGLKILTPEIFLVAGCLVCSVVSLATGSSWSTVASVGIALMAIGQALGFSEGMIAGAIISGAYFGDKMSPLSDTTNLAPAVAGTDLFTHIRYMTYTTVPSIILTLILFTAIGLFGEVAGATTDVQPMLDALDGAFFISPVAFLVPVIVIFMIVRKVPAIPALFIGAVLGAVYALLFQPDVLAGVAVPRGEGLLRSMAASLKVMGEGVTVITGHEAMDGLLDSGGMAGMLSTIWLIICAMIFGGAMEGAGMLQRITKALMSLVVGEGSLIATTAGTTLFMNATASDQYLAIVVPGRMYADAYRKYGLHPKVLSRTLEDSGTVTSVLVPWNTCGAFHAQTLGVTTLTYLPFCFFNIISPVMTVFQGMIGYRIARLIEPKA
jgi:NhaC family Na+:H+ antiporter